MGTPNCISRVGALAVALGVGAAVATTPAISVAEPGTTASSNASSSSSSNDASTSSKRDPSSVNAPDATSTADDSPSKSNGPADTPPTPTASKSGGEHNFSATADSLDPGALDSGLTDPVDDFAPLEESLATATNEASMDEPDPPAVVGGTDDDTEALDDEETSAQIDAAEAQEDTPVGEAPAPPPPQPAEPVRSARSAIPGSPHSLLTSRASLPADPIDMAASINTVGFEQAADSLTDLDLTGEQSSAAANRSDGLAPPEVGPTAKATAASIQPAAMAATAAESRVKPRLRRLTKVVDTVVRGVSDLFTAALGRFAPDGSGTLPGLWAMLAFARRDIGDVRAPSSKALPGTANQVVAATEEPTALANAVDLGTSGNSITTFPASARTWIETYVDLEPLLSGRAWLPRALWPVFFNETPVASPMQVDLDLAAGQTSGQIPFAAFDPRRRPHHVLGTY